VVATPGYTPIHDDHAYDRLAVAVASTGAYPLDNGRPTAYRATRTCSEGSMR